MRRGSESPTVISARGLASRPCDRTGEGRNRGAHGRRVHPVPLRRSGERRRANSLTPRVWDPRRNSPCRRARPYASRRSTRVSILGGGAHDRLDATRACRDRCDRCSDQVEDRPDYTILLRHAKDGHQQAYGQLSALLRLEGDKPSQSAGLIGTLATLQTRLTQMIGRTITLQAMRWSKSTSTNRFGTRARPRRACAARCSTSWRITRSSEP